MNNHVQVQSHLKGVPKDGNGVMNILISLFATTCTEKQFTLGACLLSVTMKNIPSPVHICPHVNQNIHLLSSQRCHVYISYCFGL